jgi:hypothetical protein
LFLDESAKAFERIWCDYELFRTITDNKELHIISKHGAPRLLTERPLLGETLVGKSHRDQAFPIEVLGKGVSVKLQDGNASVEEDKKNILESMGKTATGSFDESLVLQNVDIANKTLASFCAIAAWPQALRRQLVKEFPVGEGIVMALPDVLKADETRTKLEMSFCGVAEVDDRQLSLIAKGFPPKLKSLNLCFESCVNITDQGLIALMQGVSILQLSYLSLDFVGCTKLTDRGMQSLADCLPNQSLKELKLNFAVCPLITERGVASLGLHLPKCLKKLEANFIGTALNQEFSTLNKFAKACTSMTRQSSRRQWKSSM